MPDLPRSPEALVRRIRRKMDALALDAQRHPQLARTLRSVRRAMIWSVKRFLPGALQRRELLQARQVMADAPAQPSTGAKVLFMSFRAWTSHLAWETTIAQALRLRGARCEFFFCGSGLPICEIGWPAAENNKPCEFCAPYVAAMIDAASFPRVSLGDLVSDDERTATMQAAREAGSAEHSARDATVQQSLVWHFRSATLADTAEMRQARSDFHAGAAVMALAAPRLLERVQPDVIVMLNGYFYEERIVREVAAARGIRVVTYEVGAQQGTLFFSDLPAPDYDITALWAEDGQRPLSDAQDHAVESVLKGRRQGAGLSRQFYRRTSTVPGMEGRPRFALFTNVSWDTAVTGQSFAFGSMFEWIAETIRQVGSHPGLDLVIRVHPAESRWPRLESRERVSDLIARQFPVLPPNVRVIPPEEAVDSYALMQESAAVLVFSSTVGLEAAASGKPVAVAGRTHYRAKGFTTDVASPEDYAALFDDLAWTKPDPARQSLARTYAYLFFCRAIIPFSAVVEDEPAEPVFMFSQVADLAPGQDAMLDFIADRILAGGPFWLPADFREAHRAGTEPGDPSREPG